MDEFQVGQLAQRLGFVECVGWSLEEAEARLLIQQLKPWLPEGAVAA
jgi:hypothetical protein